MASRAPRESDRTEPDTPGDSFSAEDLPRRFRSRYLLAAFVFTNGFVTIALLSLLAMTFRTPFVFPSLGPTAFVFFFAPNQPAASPRNAICGHAIGLICGYGALLVTGLTEAGPAAQVGVDLDRAIAAALSLACTGGLLILLRVVHAPAGATTLIVSLGIVTEPRHLLTIEAAVALLALQAFAIHRLTGYPYPLWAAPGGPNGKHSS